MIKLRDERESTMKSATRKSTQLRKKKIAK